MNASVLFLSEAFPDDPALELDSRQRPREVVSLHDGAAELFEHLKLRLRFDALGEMPDWNTLDARFGKTFRLGNLGCLGLKVIGRNLLDCRYETVSGYPMPGRSLLGGLEFKF